MTLLYSDPVFLKHDTKKHPERAQRLEQVVAHLARVGLDKQCQRPHWEPASRERLVRLHDAHYIDEVRDFAAHGGGRIEADTVMLRDSYDVALQAAGAVADAVTCVVKGEDTQALCLVRPPGHHALSDAAMGFCLFNNVAVGCVSPRLNTHPSIMC